MRRFLLPMFLLAACGGSNGTPPPGKTGADYTLWGWATGTAGLFGSNDDGKTWDKVTDEPSQALGAARLGGRIVVTSAHADVRTTDDEGKTWASVTVSGFPDVPSHVFYGGASTLYLGAQGLVFKSADQGATWTSSGTGLPMSGGSGVHVESIVEAGSSVLVMPSLAGVYRSTDGAQSFGESNGGLSNTVYANAVASSLASFGGKVYAAFQGTGVFVSSDDGQTWATASAGLPGTGVGRIWAAGTRLFAGPPGAGLYVTTDGTTWTQTCGLPSGESVMSLTSKGDKLYLVTTNNLVPGFFVSTDGGQTCTAGTQTQSSDGVKDPLAYVFPR